MGRNSNKRLSLSLKLNLLLISVILLVTIGLVWNSYRVYSIRIREHFLSQTEMAAHTANEEIIPELVRHLWNEINTEEFREVREEAINKNDEDIIKDWMISRPSGLQILANTAGEHDPNAIEDVIFFVQPTGDDNLYSDYLLMGTKLFELSNLFEISDAYIQYDENAVTYNLIDPNENLLYIGSIEEPIDAFAGYSDNDYFPPTIYHSEFGWLATTLLPLKKTADGEIAGYVGIDTDMNHVVKQQRMFLLNSGIYVLALTTVAILISMILLRRTAIDPLRQLSQASAAFAKDDDELTQEDLIELPIRSNDEIGDLYHQFRSMQTRIIKYTDNITRITTDKERVSTELHMARTIQRSMLPGAFPAFPERTEFELYAAMKPAREVGGDFYDFFMPDDTHIAVVIADVSDKGFPAALFMMSSKILINYRTRQGGTPAEILKDVNNQICLENTSKMFVTVWLGILDLTTGVITCSNAGHEYPFIRGRDGSFHMFRDKHGFVVGALPNRKYTNYELKLEPGDAVFVYTDGIPEANGQNGELYGIKRLEKALNRVSIENPQHILEDIQTDVDAFVNGAKQSDDLTMLCIKYRQPFVPRTDI